MIWPNTFGFNVFNTNSLGLLLLVQCLFSALVVKVSTTLWLKQAKYQQFAWWLGLSLGTFLPVLGNTLYILLSIMLVTKRSNKGQTHQIINSEYPQALQSITEHSVLKSQMAQSQRLSPRATLNQRSTSLRLLNAISKPENAEINRTLLKDSCDEIRLQAFNLIDRQEQSIRNRINELEHRLLQKNNLHQLFLIHKQLAFCYWEFIYLNLIDKNLEGTFCGKAIMHAQFALELEKDNGALHSLLGKIDIHQNKLDQAKSKLEHALQCHAPVYLVIPSLAEIAYMQKDFNKLKALLSLYPELKFTPKLQSILDFWLSPGADWHDAQRS